MNDVELRFHDDGARDQLPIVLLHAFPLHSAMWEGQRSALRGRARIITLDTRGLGPGAPAPLAYMLEHLVDDLFALLDRLSIESCLLCGLSMGGYVALRAVQRSPERVRALLLAATQAGSDSDEVKLARAGGLRTLHGEGREAFARVQPQRLLSPHTVKERPELVARVTRMIGEASVEGIAASLTALATRTDTRAALANIRVPTRVVVGADDVVISTEVARSLTAAITGADLTVLQQAGHICNLEAEEAFNRVLLELVQRAG
jgi:3-oxoadipate enol-lactonase